jgi:hypothetical protein
MAIVGAAGLLVWAAWIQVQVDGATECPRPEQVATALGALLPLGAEVDRHGDPDRAHLSQEDGALVAVLERADGALLGVRRFPPHHACADLGAAVAVSLAEMESDVHPEFGVTLPSGAGTPPASRSPWLAAHAGDSEARPAGGSRFRAMLGLTLGLGGAFDVASGATMPSAQGGGRADAAVGTWVTPSGWTRTAARVELEAQSQQRLAFDTGAAAWRRWTLAAGLERAIWQDDRPRADDPGRDRRGWLRAFAVARLAWLDLHGQGFTVDRTDRSVDPGLAAGLRAVTERGPFSIWIEAGVGWWPVEHEIRATGLGALGRLPAAEAWVRVGGGVIALR